VSVYMSVCVYVCVCVCVYVYCVCVCMCVSVKCYEQNDVFLRMDVAKSKRFFF